MIMIDVLIPALDEVYDFEIDRRIGVREFTEKVKGLVEDREEMCFDDKERLVFFADRGEFLSNEGSLESQGVDSGDRLILI